ncbi:MAG: alpha/beta hydrolase [Prevotella sp.]|uniref:alpha/beta hydrolase n=1 Tax=Prevotella sp. AGR2160 TaxID=1280674 RepID=UPI00048E3122|nr:alpha/beta hydrolase [Prevotella sp. AGR2160]MDD5862939.1 alpha/beta hydrolase [Prevotella sp.]
MNKKLSVLVTILMTIGLFTAMTTNGKTARRFVMDLNTPGDSALLVFLPDHPTGRAVVDLPGGGYEHLAMQHEGTDWAPFFNDRGIALIVLKYRMPNGDRWLPIADGEKALQVVRDSALSWHIDRKNIGIMGSSAGGHLATTLSTHGPAATRPAFTILFYPVVTMGEGTHGGSRDHLLGTLRNDSSVVAEYSNERQVHKGVTPPAIIILADDDHVVPPVENGVAYYSALRRAGIPCSLYVYPSGDHGFGFRTSWKYHDLMLNELSAWLSYRK